MTEPAIICSGCKHDAYSCAKAEWVDGYLKWPEGFCFESDDAALQAKRRAEYERELEAAP